MIYITRKEIADAAHKNIEDDFASVIASALYQR